jgi:CBS domain-containing protein
MKASPGKRLKVKRTKKRGEQKRTGGGPGRRSGLTAADIMVQDVITVRPEVPVDAVSELFQMSNISGAPVVKEDGELVGIVTEDDIVFGQMGFTDEELDVLDGETMEAEAGAAAEKPAPDAEGPAGGKEDGVGDSPHKVGEIMTPNPIAVEEDTPLEEICRIMSRLRIHRVPVVRNRKVTGIISTVDICRLIVEGKARLVPTGE